MCEWWNVGCKVGEGVENIVGDAIENMASAVLEAVGTAVASLGTMWVYIGTPNLTGGGSDVDGSAPGAFSAPVLTILNYVTWIGLAVAVASAITLGAMVALKMRRGEGMQAVGKFGLILGGVILVSASSSLVAGLLPSGPGQAGGSVAFLQGSLWWLMMAVAVGGVIMGGIRMAVQQRAQPGKDVAIGLLQLIVIAGAGVTFVGLLVTAMDSFSVWIINASLDCDVTAGDGTCFGRNITTLLAFTTGSGGLGALLVIVLGIIAVLCAVFQIVLMIARGGMLVILTGILPLSAAAAITGESGKGWLQKNLSWLIAFILYKPAAAIIYAAAFQLAGTDVFRDDGSGLLSVLTGIMMMVLALFAMPALMRFVTPMVGSMAAGAGGAALAAGAIAALPSGAAAIGRMASGSGGGSSESSSSGNSNTASPSGSDGSAGGQGSQGGSGTSGSTGSQGGSGSSGGTGAGGESSGAAASSGGAAAGAGGGAAASSGGAAAGAGGGAAAGAGAAAGGGAAAGATAGAAGGPVGMAAGAAIGVAKGAADAVAGAAQSIGDEATGEGPSGS
ncbi:hypothetical protein AA310_00065 [Arthrobacter sp. YC-RL1]|uniref:hypothetical protein n=1 Tax=Arthrobacter sp. YC-RL1 TaxID=1652545 RepID=UPI00063DA4EA|nr:hypothetical protein [Arthrobacter sp. YC-RL1]KLI90698.1 hypothetical protein AA310_00065 [Arthrobacter sp. YC-RL1]